ncbi:MAG: autotransporter outer membrane beta-barrel domain-containing protein [Selenomonadaceae bacterium]|nr:autotransporter outer membrane beta-barrel domain-containing protein [Selenomonadaceae bacterium]
MKRKAKKVFFIGIISLVTNFGAGYCEEANEFGLKKQNSAPPTIYMYPSTESAYLLWSAADLTNKMLVIGNKTDAVNFNDESWKFYGGFSVNFGEIDGYTLIIDKVKGSNLNVYGGYIENNKFVSNNAVKIANSEVGDVYGGYARKELRGSRIQYFGDVKNNIVVIANESPDTHKIQNAYGGYGNNVNENKICLKNATIAGELAGAKTDELSEYKDNELVLLSADNKAGKIAKFDTIRFGMTSSETNEAEFPVKRNGIVFIEKPALSWLKGRTVLNVGSAENIGNIDASGVDFSNVDFTLKETLGEKMTLISSEAEDLPDLSANESVNVNDNGNITKIENGSFKDFDDGVVVNYEPFQQIMSSGKAIVSQIKGKVKEIVFGAVPWKTTGSLIEKTENLDFNGAKVNTSAIHFKDISELKTDDSMILVEGFGETEEANIVGGEYTIGTTLKGEGRAKIDNENLIFVVKTGTTKPSTENTDDTGGTSDEGDDTSLTDEEEERIRQEEEQKRLEEEKKRQEEQKRLEEEKRKQEEEQKRLEEEKRKQEEEQKRLEEEKRKQEEEQKRLEEEKRKQEEQKRLEEEKKKQEEQKRLEEEKRKQEEEQKRLEEEKRKQEEQKRLEEEKKKQEEEQKRLEEERKKEEERQKAEAERQEKLKQARLKVQEQTHNAVMGIQAGMVAVSAANEFVQTAMEQISTDAKTSADGVAVYAGMGGGVSHTNTGSGVNSRLWNGIVAIGQERNLSSGLFSYGAFVEYGRASYTIEPDNGMDGVSKYTGGGVFVKRTNGNDAYVEGSLRIGNIKDSVNGILEDVAGNRYGYGASSSYFGAHVGVGRKYRLENDYCLDCYGKFFYTRRGGISYNAGGEYDLDAVASKILRVGVRYGKSVVGWNGYAGLSYAYEFDGVARGFADGYSIRPAEATGGTLYGEIGLRLLPSSASKWKSDVKIKAHVGKSRGIGGHISIAYLF